MKKIGKVLIATVMSFTMLSGVCSAAEVGAAAQAPAKAQQSSVQYEFHSLKVGESVLLSLGTGSAANYSIDPASTGEVSITNGGILGSTRRVTGVKSGWVTIWVYSDSGAVANQIDFLVY